MQQIKERFPFSEIQKKGGLPYLPLRLTLIENSLDVYGLLDTGASVNVLPYSIGKRLGAVWEEQNTKLILSGNLAQFEARAIIISAKVGKFFPINLAFAWTKCENVPLILGQVNFFLEFDVCFFASEMFFEITRNN
ncbi:MAG: retropepsin-like domain-containing protein [Desulfamplus sp.]|nr:retropepsin-like domain-containing protein [Desulfamplus sp.]